MTGFSFYNIKRTPKDRGGGRVGAVVKRNRGEMMGGVDGKSNLLEFYPGGGACVSGMFLCFWRVPVLIQGTLSRDFRFNAPEVTRTTRRKATHVSRIIFWAVQPVK